MAAAPQSPSGKYAMWGVILLIAGLIFLVLVAYGYVAPHPGY